jgi:hypothetical protein
MFFLYIKKIEHCRPQKLLPAYPTSGRAVTVRYLLSHTSGSP